VGDTKTQQKIVKVNIEAIRLIECGDGHCIAINSGMCSLYPLFPLYLLLVPLSLLFFSSLALPLLFASSYFHRSLILPLLFSLSPILHFFLSERYIKSPSASSFSFSFSFLMLKKIIECLLGVAIGLDNAACCPMATILSPL
jgi:hypothetical protein